MSNVKSLVAITVTSVTAAVSVSAVAALVETAGQAESVYVAQADSAAATDGEVRKVDKEAKKITLKHGEIKNLGMPPMTMVFQVKDPSMLDKVQAGDKVRFTAENANGALVVTAIEPVR